MQDDLTEEPIAPRRLARFGPWIVVAVVALGVAGAIALLLRQASRPLPDRVAVAVQGCGARCDPDLTRAIMSGLWRTGLEGRALDGTGAARSVSGARAEARELRAGYVVYITVTALEERPGITGSTVLVAAKATARLFAADGDAAPLFEHAVTLALERPTRERALYAMGGPFADAIFPDVAQGLFERNDVKNAVESHRNIEGFARAERFDRSLRAATSRGKSMRSYRASCAAEARAVAELGLHGVHCMTAGCDEEYAVGVLPDGSAAVVQVATPMVGFPFDADAEPARLASLERIDVVPLLGGARRRLTIAQRIYGYPSLAENGSTVAYVEATTTNFGLVVIDVASGARRVVHTTERVDRMQDPKVSPDGRRLLVTVRHGRDGPPQLLIGSTSGGGMRVLGDGLGPSRWVTLGLPAGTAPRALVAAYVRPDAPTSPATPQPPVVAPAPPDGGLAPPTTWPTRPWVRVIDPESGATVARVGGEEHAVVDVSGASGGALFVEWDDGEAGCGIGRFDPATGVTRWIATTTCAVNLAVAADGVLVGEAIVTRPGDPSPGDAEVATVDPATGAVAGLTATTSRERYVRTARSSRRIVFEHVAAGSYRGLPRVAVCSMER